MMLFLLPVAALASVWPAANVTAFQAVEHAMLLPLPALPAAPKFVLCPPPPMSQTAYDVEPSQLVYACKCPCPKESVVTPLELCLLVLILLQPG